ncbi:U-box domain-containing protein 21-like [Cryptomeria japonica]|uniref:U-box domain-containing protein 21-like n=1 Tax=Cryptomeria japonica TaxID=3369 RepID=UPI0027DA98A4|nr:U-box domain-containing protein 21-like [Cryptomeria japonica]
MDSEVAVPSYLRCPISLELMKDPVILCTGLTYDRHSIETWLDAGNSVCPLTNQILHTRDMIPNHALRRIIQDWCVANGIHAPKAPLDPEQLNTIVAEISSGEKGSIRKLRQLGRESDRNKKCIASSNAPSVLASVFARHSTEALNRSQHSVEICEEALGVLIMTLPLTSQALDSLALSDAISYLVCNLREGNTEAKNSVVTILQGMVSQDKYRDTIGKSEGLTEGMVQLLRESISPAVRKSSLGIIYNIALRQRYRSKVVEAGAVPLLVEMLVDGDRSICERALLVLDILCYCTEGRAAASAHALTLPVVVKKVLRVSDSATELAVSVLWNICQNSSDGGAVREALHAGALDKLLLLVQVGCCEQTRDKSSKLLKLFNAHTGDWKCAETLNLHHVKRSF